METTDASLSLDGQCPLERLVLLFDPPYLLIRMWNHLVFAIRVMADAAADISKSGLLDDSHEG